MAVELQVRVPDIGDFDDVEVVEVLVAPGDRVEVEDSLITLESDKASMEIPSPRAGTVRELSVAVGDKVSEGALILVLESDAEGASESAAEEAPPALPEPPEAEAVAPVRPATAPPAPSRPRPPLPDLPAATGSLPHAGPLVRKMARELGVDLARTQASGPKGRILHEDVQQHVRRALSGAARVAPDSAPIDFSEFGPIEVRELSRIQKTSGRNLSRSWQSVPHVTQHDEADITELEAFRRRQRVGESGPRLSVLPFIMTASVNALEHFPALRSSLSPDGQSLVVKNYFHIGVAVDTEQGLVVPVVRDVDKKGLLELADELAELAEKARRRRLSPVDLQGACFTISSLGGIGGTHFTPIVNAPEVALLGVSRAARRPVWEEAADGSDGGFVPRWMLPLSLSYDHRVVDGAVAVRFTTHLAGLLAHLPRLLL